MSNAEALLRLKSDSQDDWNKWRADVYPEYIDLSGVALQRADLSHRDLSRSNFAGADLSYANLSKSTLHEADFSEANLQQAILTGVTALRSEFRAANLRSADLSQASLDRSNFADGNLALANLSYATLRHSHFERSNLRGAALKGADLENSHFEQASLREADLSGANFTSANLQDSSLREAKLTETNFQNADLSRTDLVWALDLVSLRGVKVSGQYPDNETFEGLETTKGFSKLYVTAAQILDSSYSGLGFLAAVSRRGIPRILPVVFSICWLGNELVQAAHEALPKLASTGISEAFAATESKPGAPYVPPLGLSQEKFDIIVFLFVGVLFVMMLTLVWAGYLAKTKSSKAATLCEHFGTFLLGAFFGRQGISQL
jgi:uncharacterized protein YjbI with pentapeptide repeats